MCWSRSRVSGWSRSGSGRGRCSRSRPAGPGALSGAVSSSSRSASAAVPGLACARAGVVTVPGGVEVQGGELVQDGPVDVPAHHRGQCRITRGRVRLRPGQIHRSGDPGGRGAGGGPAALQSEAPARPLSSARSTCTVTCTGWLLPSAGQHPRLDQPLAGLGERIMLALDQGAGIFGAAAGPERGQHRGHRGGGGAGQVPGKAPGPADGGFQPHRPVIEPVLVPVRGAAGPLDHLLGQRGQIRQPRPAVGGGEQDRVRVRAALVGQLIGPLAHRLRPRRRQLPGRQRGGDQRMGGQPPGPRSPPHRRRRW